MCISIYIYNIYIYIYYIYIVYIYILYIYIVYIYIFTYYVLGQKLTHHTQTSFEIYGAFEAEEGFVLDEAAPLLAAAPPTPAISAKAMAQGTEAGWFRVSSHLGAQKKN